MEIPVIPNGYMPEGVMTCGVETAAKVKVELDQLTAERDRYKGALEIIAALVLSYDIPPMWEARTIACEALSPETKEAQ